jgi:hypothetical protein
MFFSLTKSGNDNDQSNYEIHRLKIREFRAGGMAKGV